MFVVRVVVSFLLLFGLDLWLVWIMFWFVVVLDLYSVVCGSLFGGWFVCCLSVCLVFMLALWFVLGLCVWKLLCLVTALCLWFLVLGLVTGFVICYLVLCVVCVVCFHCVWCFDCDVCADCVVCNLSYNRRAVALTQMSVAVRGYATGHKHFADTPFAAS